MQNQRFKSVRNHQNVRCAGGPSIRPEMAYLLQIWVQFPSLQVAKCSDQLGHIVRELCRKLDSFSACRVFKLQKMSVKRLSGKVVDCLSERFWQGVGFGPVALTIVAISNHRMPDMGHVHADLVGPAGFEPALDQTCNGRCIWRFAIAFFHCEMRDSMARIPTEVAFDGPMDAVTGTTNRCVNGACQRSVAPPDQCMIGAFQNTCAAMIGKLVSQ